MLSGHGLTYALPASTPRDPTRPGARHRSAHWEKSILPQTELESLPGEVIETWAEPLGQEGETREFLSPNDLGPLLSARRFAGESCGEVVWTNISRVRVLRTAAVVRDWLSPCGVRFDWPPQPHSPAESTKMPARKRNHPRGFRALITSPTPRKNQKIAAWERILILVCRPGKGNVPL